MKAGNFVALLVIGAGVYGLTTDTGGRYVDKMLSALAMEADLNLDFNSLSAEMSRDQVRHTYQHIKLKCGPSRSQFGNLSCGSEIATFNGIVAENVEFIFSSAGLQSVRVTFKGREHQDLIAQLRASHGLPRRLGENRKDGYGNPLLAWDIRTGIVMASERLNKKDESVLQWVSIRVLTEGLF